MPSNGSRKSDAKTTQKRRQSDAKTTQKMDRNAVEFTRITSTDSLDEHYLTMKTQPKEVKLAVCPEEEEEEKQVKTFLYCRL